jgi:hypothetical protein
VFHYVPEASTEIAELYHPLVRPDRRTVTIAAATGGCPCGDFSTISP